MNTGRLIRVLRTAQGSTQEEIAEKLGISRSYLSQVEKGIRKPGLEFLRKLSTALNVPTALLVMGDDDDESPIMIALRKMLGEIILARLAISGSSIDEAGDMISSILPDEAAVEDSPAILKRKKDDGLNR